MSEYNKIAEGQFTSTGVAEFVTLPFLPNSFEMWNVTAYGTPTQNEITHAISWRNATAGTASVEYFNATPVLTTTNLASGGLSFIQAGTYQYGPNITITSVSQAAAAVVTAVGHGLSTGDAVLIYGVADMLQISGEVYTVTVTGANTFTIPVDSSGFASAGTGGICKRLLYPDLYIPYRCAITGITTGATTTLTLALDHQFVVGQEVFIQIPRVSATAWGTFQLDTEAYNAANVVPQQAYVTAVGAANQITINVNSTGFGAFAYPTSAQAALGMTFPAVYAIGDQNFGPTGPGPFQAPITIPGAFAANTRQGVLIGLGNGTQLLHQNNDVVRWRAVFPDLIIP